MNGVMWCGGWDSNPRRPTPQDFSCEPDLKSSPVRSRERSCPFDLNPATIGPGPMHGLGNPRIERLFPISTLKTKKHFFTMNHEYAESRGTLSYLRRGD